MRLVVVFARFVVARRSHALNRAILTGASFAWVGGGDGVTVLVGFSAVWFFAVLALRRALPFALYGNPGACRHTRVAVCLAVAATNRIHLTRTVLRLSFAGSGDVGASAVFRLVAVLTCRTGLHPSTSTLLLCTSLFRTHDQASFARTGIAAVFRLKAVFLCVRLTIVSALLIGQGLTEATQTFLRGITVTIVHTLLHRATAR